MPEIVMVSDVESIEKLRSSVEELFMKGRYEEISRAIGMYSILTDPQHMRKDQPQLFHLVLELIKNRIMKEKRNDYSAWLSAFPKLMSELAAGHTVVTDRAAADALASHHSANGPFRSIDEFFFWALEDRRLPLGNIVKYIEKTVISQNAK